MPELPEVETIRRGLHPVLAGRRLTAVVTRREDLRRPFPPAFAQRMCDKRILNIDRRGKYLCLELSGGDSLLVHLGMSGRLSVVAEARPPNLYSFGKHDHVGLFLDSGTAVIYNDVRRFGLMTLWPTMRLDDYAPFHRMGPEPLDAGFDGKVLGSRFKGRTASVKSALLDQKTVAGLGNIYACEALWRAGISPFDEAGKLSGSEVDRLASEVREVLLEAIAAGGTTLRDYRQTDGELGYFQHAFRVYGKEEQPCPRAHCKGKIARVVQAGRSTFHCMACQGADRQARTNR